MIRNEIYKIDLKMECIMNIFVEISKSLEGLFFGCDN